MKHGYLEVTYRKGKPLAGYYYLPHEGADPSVRTESVEGGMLVDYAADGRPIGIEFPTPGRVDPAAVNRLLDRLGLPPVDRNEFAPLAVA